MVQEEKLSVVISEFARTLVTDFPIQGRLDRLVERIVDVLPVTGAGVTLISPGFAPQYVAASNAGALRFEQLQTEVGIELGHLGDCVGRPSPVRLPWVDDGSVWDGADMWATAAESMDELLMLYRTAWGHSDESVDQLGLAAPSARLLVARAATADHTRIVAGPRRGRDRPTRGTRRHPARADRRPGGGRPRRRRRRLVDPPRRAGRAGGGQARRTHPVRTLLMRTLRRRGQSRSPPFVETGTNDQPAPTATAATGSFISDTSKRYWKTWPQSSGSTPVNA